MELLKIKKYPENILRRKAKPVSEVTSYQRELFDKMLYSMRHHQGVGLAAPQIGLSIQMLVAQIDNQIFKLINPKIVLSKGSNRLVEGCLSFPDLEVDIKRAAFIRIEAINDEGKKIQFDAEGLIARVLQHEIDHLNGKLIVDYMGFWKKRKFRKKDK